MNPNAQRYIGTKPPRTGVFVFCVTAFLLSFVAANAQIGGGFDLTWSTIDSGGVMRSTGGAFELSGTIGQADAGVMAGGDLTLTGGFWFEVLPSDCNEDGVVNLFDYDTFQTCLTGPGGGPLSPGCNCYDFDRDGVATLLDCP